jgi:hypothetical protein
VSAGTRRSAVANSTWVPLAEIRTSFTTSIPAVPPDTSLTVPPERS